jgi:hypothetical protein
VAIRSDASEEEFDSTCLTYLFFILGTFCGQVWSIPVKDIDVGRVDIDVGEEVCVHEAVIALGVVPRESDVFVLEEVNSCMCWSGERASYHVESHDILEGDVSSLESLDQVLVDYHRAATCWQSQDEGSLRGWSEVIDAAYSTYQKQEYATQNTTAIETYG